MPSCPQGSYGCRNEEVRKQGRASGTIKDVTPAVGVDVGKEKLELAFIPQAGPVEIFPNRAKGRGRLIQRVKVRGAPHFGL